jgi:8-oxo-dGTP diphosphatase
VEIGELLAESTFSTANNTIHLLAYLVKNYYGEIQLTVHDSMEWVPLYSLLTHDQLPADYIISQKLLEVL